MYAAVRIFGWGRLGLLLVVLAAGGLWGRSYFRADGLNYRTAGQVHWNLRLQSGALVGERIDESLIFRATSDVYGLWYEAPDGVLDTGRWGQTYSVTRRWDGLGFVGIEGAYMKVYARDTFSGVTLWAPARGVAMPFWFVMGVPLAVLLCRLRGAWAAWRKRQRVTAGCCASCGYDLRASVGRCPECGAAMERGAGAAGGI